MSEVRSDKPVDARHDLGRRGEEEAERHLRARGMSTLARRYRAPRGEIDLIMRDGDTVVFVEVKSLSSEELKEPREALRKPQLSALATAAKSFVSAKALQNRPLRIDVVEVLFNKTAPPKITHTADAFRPPRW